MIALRDAVAADGPAVAAVGRRAFAETFGTLYAPVDLATFLDQAFGPAGLPAQCGDPAWRIRLALDGEAIVGFAKLGPVGFPGDWPATAVELYQLYVLGSHHGAGVGPMLMDWAVEAARAGGATELLLSVFVDNHRAKRLYARYGFVDIGRFDFRVGDHIDEDRLMRLVL